MCSLLTCLIVSQSMSSTFIIGTSPLKFSYEPYRVFSDCLLQLQSRLFINIAEQKSIADVCEEISHLQTFFNFIRKGIWLWGISKKMINSLTLPGNIRGFSRRDNSSLPICIRSGYFIPVCSRDKFSNSRQIHPVGASKSLIVSFFILDISVIIRFLLRVKSIGVFGVSICLHSLVLVQGCLHDKNQLHS